MSAIQEYHPRLNDFPPGNTVMNHRKFQRHDIGLAETLAKTLGLRDQTLPDHSFRVSNFAVKLARWLGLPEEQVDIIRRGSLLHDIGKLGIPQDILSKPGLLTDHENQLIQTHPSLGAALLIQCPGYRALSPLCFTTMNISTAGVIRTELPATRSNLKPASFLSPKPLMSCCQTVPIVVLCPSLR